MLCWVGMPVLPAADTATRLQAFRLCRAVAFAVLRNPSLTDDAALELAIERLDPSPAAVALARAAILETRRRLALPRGLAQA